MYLIVNIYAVKCYGSIYMMIMYIYSIHMLGDIWDISSNEIQAHIEINILKYSKTICWELPWKLWPILNGFTVCLLKWNTMNVLSWPTPLQEFGCRASLERKTKLHVRIWICTSPFLPMRDIVWSCERKTFWERHIANQLYNLWYT